ncbi:Trp biosynthesis-associated membrane protein [Actinocorallia populi]|uniref:Trp biosynthesis-associated membrane protein n=1 Tax=Actinocorallia populi TaxID=2079200 RepID=UPI000D08660D|nr:Trp biosynthesis-associated membrane protein [Actinocorallia populi]
MTAPAREAGPRPASRGREALLAAGVCAAGASLVVYASGRTWATVDPAAQGAENLQVAGEALTATGALGWASLAALAALAATRGRARIAVGTVLALLGAAVCVLSLTAADASSVAKAAADVSALFNAADPHTVTTTAWPAWSAAGGVLTVLAGLLTAVRGRHWPGMSARYDRGAKAGGRARADDPAALWKSLDRGEDPTAADPEEH